MKRIALIAAVLTVAGCANNVDQGGAIRQTWIPTGSTQLSEAQALAECRYDIIQNPNNFDNLAKLAGQAGVAPDGRIRGLSSSGNGMFHMCMNAKGFTAGAVVPNDTVKG